MQQKLLLGRLQDDDIDRANCCRFQNANAKDIQNPSVLTGLVRGKISRQSGRETTGTAGFTFVGGGSVLAGGIVSKPSPGCDQSLKQVQCIIQDRVTTGLNDDS